uniref:Uncharacterized protein n=1 Tax=Angiostrongylus cantonensis TaxID=6313 RepID=A0A0K0DJ16_ANGCA
MKRSTAVASEESLRSPSIPPIRFDFNDEPRRPDVDNSPYMAPFSSQDNYSYERGSKDLVKRTRIYNTDEGSSLERLPKDFYARQPVPRLSSKFPGNTLSSFSTAGPFCSSRHKYDFGAFRKLSDEAPEFADVNISIGRHVAQRESHDDSTHVELVPSAGVPSVPRTGLRNHPSAQLQPSSRTPRPAFDVHKAASSVEEGEREKTYVVRMNHTSHHMAKMNELYERERNLWFQQRGSNRQCPEMSKGISNPPAQEMSFQRDSNVECQEMSK